MQLPSGNRCFIFANKFAISLQTLMLFLHQFHSVECKSLQNVEKVQYFYEIILIEIAFAKCLQPACKYFAMNSRRILHKRCNKFAKSLQILISIATTLQKFAAVLQGILQKCAISLQKHCKILQNLSHERNLNRPQFCIILQTIRCTLWEMGSGFCKKI